MVVYTFEKRREILRHIFENYGNVADCMRILHADFEKTETPAALYVRYLMKKRERNWHPHR